MKAESIVCTFKKCSYLYLRMEIESGMNSVANSGRSSVIADNLGVLVGQNRCRLLIMTEHN